MAGGDGVAWLDLRPLILMATPVILVAALAVGWGVAGERRFAGVAPVALGLFASSLQLGPG